MIRSLTDDQYAVFMSNLDQAKIRDRCILLFMLHSGLRNGEVCNLRWIEVCIEGEMFHTIRVINGHSRKKNFRYVTLSGKLRESISIYLEWYETRYGARDSEKHMFITQNQKVGIQQRDIQRMVRNYTRKCLGESFTPHSLRHTFATRVLQCSNIRVVQQLLGHDSITSTQIYTHPTSEERDSAIQKAF